MTGNEEMSKERQTTLQTATPRWNPRTASFDQFDDYSFPGEGVGSTVTLVLST